MSQEHIDTIHKTLKWFYDTAHDTDELARTEEALAALSALRQQLAEAQRWTPIEPRTTLHMWDVMGNECMDVIQVSKAFEYADGPRQLLTVSEQFGANEASVYLPDNVRLCRQAAAQEEE